METRKIQTTGGGTYTVSLPKEWAEAKGIAAGDVVNLHTHIDDVVAIQARQSADTVSDRITIHVDSDDSATLERTLRAAYGAGTKEVTFDTSEAFSCEARHTIGRVIRNLTGVSVARESDTQITVQTLLDPEEVSVRQSVRQLKFVALSMHRDAIAMLTDDADSSGLADCDDQADRLYALIDRSVTRGLSRLDEVDALGLRRPELFELWTTTRELERVADHAERIVTVATKLEDPIEGDTADEIDKLAHTAREIVADAVSVILDETDVETAQRALHSRDRIREKTATFDRQPARRANPQLGLILQGLYRTAEHGGNIAEIGLQRAIRSDALPESRRTIESDEDAIEGRLPKQDDTDESDEDDDSPSLVRTKALQGVYDAGYYDGDEDGFVSLQAASDRIARYCERVSDDVPDTPSKIEALLGQFPERLLERDHRGDLYVRCTDEGKARFLSPVDEDDEVNENTDAMAHAELMRDAYDDLLAVGLPLHVVRQGGDDDPDALAEPESAELRLARSNPTLEPAEVTSLVEKFREVSPLLDRLSNAGTVDVEVEHSTGDTAPGVTIEHVARSIENGRRCLLLARPDTAESIARRLDEDPKCMRTFSDEDGAHRLYNANGDVRPNDIRVYRPAGGQSVWLYHEATGEVELRDSDGETLATFDSSEDVFADPTEYPATEKDITDFDQWSTVKRPALPSRIDRDMADVISVTDDGLEVLEPSGDRTPIGELLDDESGDQGETEESPLAKFR